MNEKLDSKNKEVVDVNAALTNENEALVKNNLVSEPKNRFQDSLGDFLNLLDD